MCVYLPTYLVIYMRVHNLIQLETQNLLKGIILKNFKNLCRSICLHRSAMNGSNDTGDGRQLVHLFCYYKVLNATCEVV